MKQLNGCSTPAPRSSAAKQWFQQLPQKIKTWEKIEGLKAAFLEELPLCCAGLISAAVYTRPHRVCSFKIQVKNFA